MTKDIVKNSNVELSMRLLEMVDSIHKVTTEASSFNDFVIKFKLPITNYNKLKNKSNTNFTFFDWVGFGTEYKQVFDVFREYTKYSKQEISYMLRVRISCYKVYKEKITFMFIISPNDLINYDYKFNTCL